jgi:hypothetical protein
MKKATSLKVKSGSNKACSRLVGFVPTYKHFPRFGLFPAPKPNPRQPHQRLTQTVGRWLIEKNLLTAKQKDYDTAKRKCFS